MIVGLVTYMRKTALDLDSRLIGYVTRSFTT